MRSGSLFQAERARLAGSSTNGRKPLRHGVGDFRHQILRGARQRGIGVARHPLRAEHAGLDLIGRQHQRRQVESLFQDVAHAGLAADRHALFDQGGDVAVDGPLRGLQLGRDRVRRQRLPGAPEHLDDLEQPVGASHGVVSFPDRRPADADSMLAAGGGVYRDNTSTEGNLSMMIFSEFGFRRSRLPLRERPDLRAGATGFASTASPSTCAGRWSNWRCVHSPRCAHSRKGSLLRWRAGSCAAAGGAARPTSPLLTPWWQQGVARLSACFREIGSPA